MQNKNRQKKNKFIISKNKRKEGTRRKRKYFFKCWRKHKGTGKNPLMKLAVKIILKWKITVVV